MKKAARFLPLVLLVSTVITGCGLAGIHLKVKNPRRAGKFPKETEARSLFGKHSSLRVAFDVTHYGIAVALDPQNHYLKGHVAITAKTVAPLDTVQLDLHPNLVLNEISWQHKPLPFVRKHRSVFVILPQTLPANTVFTLVARYEGKPMKARRAPWAGGFVWRKDKNKNPWIGVACETEGASTWWICKDDVADEPDSCDTEITVPSTLVAVSNGAFRGKDEHSNGTATYRWHVSYPINTYNVTVYAGNYALVEDSYHSPVTGLTIPVTHYVLKGHEAVARKHFEQAKDQLAFYERKFGAYPWPRDGYRLVESPYEGMEHQSAIAYGHGFRNDRVHHFDYIILHETAHEWWGNSLSAADLADGWLHEGFATYCEALYVEETGSKERLNSYLYLQKIIIKNKRPVCGKRGIRYFNYHDNDIYMKGSWILHTLRNTLENDSLFFDILKSFREENHCRQIYSESFVEMVNRKTGKDYSWFFQQYLFNRKSPVLELYWYNDKLYYHWKADVAAFRMPVYLRNSTGERLKIFPTTQVQELRLDPSFGHFTVNSTELLFGESQTKKLRKEFMRKK